jgi:hypothetical protein
LGALARVYLEQIIHSGGPPPCSMDVLDRFSLTVSLREGATLWKIAVIRGILMSVPPILPVDRPGTTASPPAADPHEPLRAAAVELEARFLSEMLKHAGFGESRGALGGGAGEAQFASLLRDEQARALAGQGGIGLAESLFDALVEREAEPGA